MWVDFTTYKKHKPTYKKHRPIDSLLKMCCTLFASTLWLLAPPSGVVGSDQEFLNSLNLGFMQMSSQILSQSDPNLYFIKYFTPRLFKSSDTLVNEGGECEVHLKEIKNG